MRNLYINTKMLSQMLEGIQQMVLSVDFKLEQILCLCSLGGTLYAVYPYSLLKAEIRSAVHGSRLLQHKAFAHDYPPTELLHWMVYFPHCLQSS